MFGFLKGLRKSSDKSSQKGRTIDPSQRQLEAFQSPPQEKRRPSVQAVSINQIENEVNDELKAFKSYVKEIKDISLRIEELIKLLKSGEISENAYKLIMNELGDQLSISVENIFNSREVLEFARAKTKLEWAREKIRLKEFEPPERQEAIKSDPALRSKIYSGLYKWEGIVSTIDAALSSLTIEEEASIIEQYLSLVKGGFSQKVESGEIEKGIAICQQRLNLISERWASIRRSKIEQIMNLELKSSQIKEEIKEIEVRFAIGELDQNAYEVRMSTLQGSLKKVEKEISDIRKYIDDMDMKMFRCVELLRGK